MIIGIGIGLIIAAVAVFFFYSIVWHTYHGDILGVFISFIILLVVAGLFLILTDHFQILELVRNWLSQYIDFL